LVPPTLTATEAYVDEEGDTGLKETEDTQDQEDRMVIMVGDLLITR